MRILGILLVGLLLGLATPLWAEVVEHEESGVQIWIPDDWAAGTRGDGLMIADDADDPSVLLIIDILPRRRPGGRGPVRRRRDRVGGLEPPDRGRGGSFRSQRNALALPRRRGTADGRTVELGFLLVKTPKGKILMAVGLGYGEELERHGRTLERIVASIRPS